MSTVSYMACLIIVILTLSACGGSSGNVSSSTPSPNGIYSGSITGGNGSPPGGSNGGEKAIIYNNQLIVVSTDNGLQQLFNGSLTLSSTSLSGSDIDYYNNTDPKITTMSVAGSFVEDQSVTINFTDNATAGTPVPDGTINLTEDTTLLSRGSAAATITATWNGIYTGFNLTMSITINADGSFAGSDSEVCNYTGTVVPANASVNVYNVSLISTGGTGCSTLPAGTYTGLAWTEGVGDNTLVFSVADGTNSRSIVMTK